MLKLLGLETNVLKKYGSVSLQIQRAGDFISGNLSVDLLSAASAECSIFEFVTPKVGLNSLTVKEVYSFVLFFFFLEVIFLLVIIFIFMVVAGSHS